MQEISICSLKDNPSLLEKAQIFLLKAWADEKSENFYKEVLQCCVKTSDFIPHFLFAIDKDRKIVGCVGIALQDFVSCANLYPFLVALYVEESYRNKKEIAKMQVLAIYIFAVIYVVFMRSLALCFTAWLMMFLALITAFIIVF
ncbi:MAG: hypothetical protein SPJ83_06370 [Helicobacter sp.]|uniref:GNAT family N-acetyltransferase n=1 Tax=Helicobacter TaxID=209 RepID=UPI002557F881|nr:MULTISPECIES: GNAT family N-acetyltransferase [Helicobacter]MDY5822395.1 hypothetical protein [Helicobacter sp.]